jgi:hypothetical protein
VEGGQRRLDVGLRCDVHANQGSAERQVCYHSGSWAVPLVTNGFRDRAKGFPDECPMVVWRDERHLVFGQPAQELSLGGL